MGHSASMQSASHAAEAVEAAKPAEAVEAAKVDQVDQVDGSAAAEGSAAAAAEAALSGQEKLDEDLIEAARQLDGDRVRGLLQDGASAAFMHEAPEVWGSRSTYTALHRAIEAARQTEDKQQAVSVIRTLVEAGADVNAQRADYDWRGCGSTNTAFQMAIPLLMGNVELLDVFLAAGADANLESRRDISSMRTDGHIVTFPIHTAVTKGDLEIARALLDARADVNALAEEKISNERGFNQDKEERPLHLACARKDLAMCALLLARGADVNAVRKELEQESTGEESPHNDPRAHGFVPSVRCVPVQETALHQALRLRDAQLVTLLACAGADRQAVRSRGGGLHGPARQSPEELCGGDAELAAALRTEWSPETHHLFPEEVRDRVKTAVLIARRQKWPLPDNVLFHILAGAASA